jgi:hypothetical protein
MFLYDQKHDLDSQFTLPQDLVFKTTSSRENTEETFVLNRKESKNFKVKPLLLGTTFQKMDINLRLNNMNFKKQETEKSKRTIEYSNHMKSMITSSSNDSQIQGNIRTSYLLEKYEFSK